MLLLFFFPFGKVGNSSEREALQRKTNRISTSCHAYQYLPYGVNHVCSPFVLWFQRPRKVSAKFAGRTFAPDEHVQPELDFDYEGKRDRWNGYDLSDHKRVVEEHHKIEEVSYNNANFIVAFSFNFTAN